MATTAAGERHSYPNPQFARTNWHNLGGQWGFARHADRIRWLELYAQAVRGLARSTVEDAAEFEARLWSLFFAIAASPHVAGYCYTQLTDTKQETNGLLTAAREPKLKIETLYQIITQPAASVPQERIDKDRRMARNASGSKG